MKSDVGFIPHEECTVASGDCFRLSKCLMGCRPSAARRADAELRKLLEQIAQLEVRIIKLESRQ